MNRREFIGKAALAAGAGAYLRIPEMKQQEYRWKTYEAPIRVSPEVKKILEQKIDAAEQEMRRQASECIFGTYD